jgi:Amt family ammonium transporter
VKPWAAVILGVCGGVICNFATKLKFLINVDDSLDIFAIHGVGGMVGNILTGIFGTYVSLLISLTSNNLLTH